MKIYNMKQGSPEWIHARLGIPTASEFDELITGEWKARTGEGVDKYIYRKLAERILGFSLNNASGWALEQGSIMEHEAIPFYEGVHDVRVQRVGFITTDDGLVGCSPDGLVGDDGGLEVKCPQPETHLRYLLNGVVPKEYLAQVHGSMYVTGRPRWTFLSYSRQFPPLIVTVERDREIDLKIAAALYVFQTKFSTQLARIQEMKAAENAVKSAAYQPDQTK